MSDRFLSDLFEAIQADLSKSIQAKLREAYERGGSDERQRIVRFASAGAAETPGSPIGRKATGRVAHGTIRPLVQQVLKEEPGLTKQEIGRRVVGLDPRVSETSVVNELQRNDAKKNKGLRLYRRRGDRWYVVEEEPLRDTAGIAEDDHPPQMNGAAGVHPTA